ncbi:MAG: putative rane protein [Anaerocolumna sp.]|jgi:membrane protein implicated in regulation of membrane protease activity|nr:putative rane protein [Anaerocolumna sp.]
MNSIYWLVALAICLVIEILTLGLTTIWFAGGALAAFLASLIFDSLLLEIIVFLAASFLLLIFTRPLAAKYFNSQRIKTNYETLFGKDGKVVEKIDNFNMTGQVIVNGQEWSARSVSDDQIIEVGQKVRIKDVSGVKLIVEIEKENNKEAL